MAERQFTGRRMRKNHSNALPRYIVAYATESEPQEIEGNKSASRDVFKRGAVISCRLVGVNPTAIQPKLINSPGEFWKHIETLSAANYTTWVIGHSILYDMLVSGMPEQFEQANFVVDWPRSKRKRETNDDTDPHSSALVVLGNPPTIIACRCVRSGGRVVFVDLLNWFPSSLDDISATADADRDDWRRSILGFQELATPSMHKCGTVLASFLKLISWARENDVGMFRYTAASQAMSAYRHRFMTHEIFVHDNWDIKHLERKAYFGGRTELFRHGTFKETMHQLDVSSLFPSVMQFGNFPVKLVRYMRTARWSANLPDLEWKNCVAKVWLKTQRPIFPIKLPQGVAYPIGEFDTFLCGQELETAFNNGEVVSVQSWAEYETAPIFTEWVTALWELRQKHQAEGDAIYATLVKLLLNGLYGKFGQKSPLWQNVPDELPATPWAEWTDTNCLTGVRRQFRSFGWQVQEYMGDGETASSFIAISAFVASAARMRMNALREIAGRENVYYQGVDGLIVTEQGRKNLDAAGEIAEGTLGKLRHQLTVDEGEILGYCDYRLGTKTVRSGMAGATILVPDGELLQQIRYVSDSMFSCGTENGVKVASVPWKRHGFSAKGVADESGRVWPFVFDFQRPQFCDNSGSVT